MLIIQSSTNFLKSFGAKKLLFLLKINCPALKVRLQYGFNKFTGVEI